VDYFKWKEIKENTLGVNPTRQFLLVILKIITLLKYLSSSSFVKAQSSTGGLRYLTSLFFVPSVNSKITKNEVHDKNNVPNIALVFGNEILK
jgi:hypothetical protein